MKWGKLRSASNLQSRRTALSERVNRSLLSGALMTVLPLMANAQTTDTTSTTDSALKSQLSTSEVAPAPPATPVVVDHEHLFNLSQSLAGVGKTLADYGIYTNGYWVNTDYDNVSGGNKRANVFFGRLIYGLDFDLGKIIGLQGGSIRIQINTKYGGFNGGENYAAGSLFGFLATQGPNNITNLADLTYHQRLFDDKVSFVVGRTSLGDYFATSPQYCQFVVGLCQNLNSFTDTYNSSAPYEPIATWAGEVAVKPTPATYLRVGVSADNLSTYYKPGFPWNNGFTLDGTTGVFIPVEVGYATTPYQERYARRYAIGFSHDTSPTFDPRTYAKTGDSDEIYAQFQQIIWRPDPNSQRSITVLGAASVNPTANTYIQSYAFLGAFVQGPFAARPDDVFGVMGTDYNINNKYTDSLDQQIAANGGTGTVAHTEQTYEVNYGVSLAPGIQFKPYAFYTVHPDQLVYGEVPSGHIKNAFGVGAQLFISFNYAFGLPSFSLND